MKKNSELFEAYKLFDIDGDGKISLQDINDLMSKLSYCGHIEDTCFKTVIKWASKNETGNITLENFEMLWKSLTKNDGDMRKAFNTLDANQDGYISKSEVAFYLKSLFNTLEKKNEDA